MVQKTCAPVDMENITNFLRRVLYIPGGCLGFLPSTVVGCVFCWDVCNTAKVKCILFADFYSQLLQSQLANSALGFDIQ